jgi:hypothetical protein
MKQRVHEFLHPLQTEYKECFYCGERKSLVCMTCGYCYECHPAMEEIERRSARLSIPVLEDLETA